MYKRIYLLKFNFLLVTAMLAALMAATAWTSHNAFAHFPYAENPGFVRMDMRYLAYMPEARKLTPAPIEGNAKSVPVLMYHGITRTDDSPIPADGYSVSPETFKDHMFALKRAGYTAITTTELEGFLLAGKELPDRSVLITFDDGRKDSFFPADPVLRALNYKATMFVITKFSLYNESVFYLHDRELEYMHRSGRWELQSHGKDDHEHYEINEDEEQGIFLTNKLWLPGEGRLETDDEYLRRVRAELEISKQELDDRYGINVTSFAFPFGDFGDRETNYPGSKDVLMSQVRAVYKLSFFQHGADTRFTHNHPAQFANDTFAHVYRVTVNSTWSGDKLVSYLEQGRAKPLPYHDAMDTDAGWIRAWNNAHFADSRMRLTPIATEAGAGAVLDGTYTWGNYSLRADVGVNDGTSVYVWVRFQDDANFAACNFGDGFLHIEESVGGVKRVIEGTREVGDLPNRTFTVGVDVVGRNVTCLIDGVPVISTQYLDPSLSHGGIGLKTWNDQVNVAKMDAYGLSVVPLDVG